MGLWAVGTVLALLSAFCFGAAIWRNCRVLRLTLLAPDIAERILDGRPTAGLAQLLQPFSVEWEQQRERLI